MTSPRLWSMCLMPHLPAHHNRQWCHRDYPHVPPTSSHANIGRRLPRGGTSGVGVISWSTIKISKKRRLEEYQKEEEFSDGASRRHQNYHHINPNRTFMHQSMGIERASNLTDV